MIAFISLLLTPLFSHAEERPLSQIKLPRGFKIEVVVDIPGARSLVESPSGTLFVSTRDEGKVYAYRDKKLFVLATGLTAPNGIDFLDGALYIAETGRISRLDRVEADLLHPPKPKIIVTDLPTQAHHGWRYMRFGPDHKLYLSVGAPCNVCKVDDPLGTIMRMNRDGSNREVYARGVRDSVGFDWDPASHELWFTDNGRDMLGDEHPPDELNHASHSGMHFGFPFCHGGDEPDPDFGKEHPCSEFVAPVQKIPAHDASLGMRFYNGKMFPSEYRGNILIAEHGSWNRSTPRGYRVSRVRLGSDGSSQGYEVFAEGWLQGGRAWGRPVDVLIAHDGSVLISDDYSGAVYRISYR